jgi:hypothetical protein
MFKKLRKSAFFFFIFLAHGSGSHPDPIRIRIHNPDKLHENLHAMNPTSDKIIPTPEH